MPYRSPLPAGRDGFAQLLRAELTKFRTVRAWVIALCAAAVLFVLLAFLSALESHSASPPVPSGPSGEPVTDSYMLVHQRLVGDGSLTVRVTSLTGAHASPPPESGQSVFSVSE